MASTDFFLWRPCAQAQTLLNVEGGPVQPPIRAEIFGPQRFAQHGISLGVTHTARRAHAYRAAFFPRLAENVRTLLVAHSYIGAQAAAGYDVSPAAEWLLDNFHLIETQLKRIHLELPRNAVRELPVLTEPPLAGLPRVYGVAWAFVAHTDGAFDEDLLVHFLRAYQQTQALNLREMWALPTTLRVLLVENLRRLAEREAAQMAARDVANLCCDAVLDRAFDDEYAPPPQVMRALVEWLAVMRRRGVEGAFLARVAQRFHERKLAPGVRLWLEQSLPDPAAVRDQQVADQTADNLSMSNAVTSLRAVNEADWPDLVARASALMCLMLSTPLFEAEHTTTRDTTLHAIERLALRCNRGELAVAQALLSRMQTLDQMAACGGDVVAAATPGYWLQGGGRDALMQDLGLHRPLMRFRRYLEPRVKLPAYLAALTLGTLFVGAATWLAGDASQHSSDPWYWLWLGLAMMVLPASEATVAVINRLVSEWVRPARLPRFAFSAGIPLEHRVMVVIPAMLSNPEAVRALAHRLHLHHLANPEHHAQFALLTDHLDAQSQDQPGDQALLDLACQEIDALNARYASPKGMAPRFLLLHRLRRWCPTERCWMGWERKRGKLVELLAALATGNETAFVGLGQRSRIEPGTRHLLTLDSDTQLPPGRLRALVGVAAHPQNHPQLSADGRHVFRGYGILQPHVVTALPAQGQSTPFYWLFAGQSGIDPYSAASSEVYQDLFAEGSFCGKGLLNVQAAHAVLGASLPEGQVLSHDLLEGSLARCAAVTDISLVEDAPFQADVASGRVHRWTRGDWQLLPFLCQPLRWPLRGVHRWKMLDNLRRSMVAPASLVLLILALCGRTITPLAALMLVFAAYSAGPLMGALAGLVSGHRDAAPRYFYGHAGIDLLRALGGGVWGVWQLGAQAWLYTDAVVRTLWRMLFSRRHLLQWTPFAATQGEGQSQLWPMLRRHAGEPVLALVLLIGLWIADGSDFVWALALTLLWASSPFANWWASKACRTAARFMLDRMQHLYLEGLARDTWRLFERCVGPEDRHLPPDNLQVLPHDMVAHRTSPTNIGLYLLSATCARAFGWIGTQDLLQRLESTLATLHSLPRHRGHFLNWYDTRTGEALLPAYVSTVDSGNLCGHLLAVAHACRELAAAPFDAVAARHAIRHSRNRLLALEGLSPLTMEPLNASVLKASPVMASLVTAFARLLASGDPLADALRDPVSFNAELEKAEIELAQCSEATQSSQSGVSQQSPKGTMLFQDLAGLQVDYLATLRSAWRDLDAHITEARLGLMAGPNLQKSSTCAGARLLELASACESMAWEADFAFLYDRKRRLLHIGWRVAEQQLDTCFYDLLASESRLASLLAIAKGDVPVGHWAALGRPFFATGMQVGLRSWSGSMFEYLMPSLVLDEPPHSVLYEASLAALAQQMTFGASHRVPWGASESAHAERDHTLAYQYAPQGVPQLALRRTSSDELVIAPYASVLAAQVDPRAAHDNLVALQSLAARGRYGMIEALDFSVTPSSGATLVATYMAHHQGMCIVALANVLLDGVARRWGMADAHIQAVASLLHERVPREVPPLPAPSGLQTRPTSAARAGSGPREVLPGVGAIEPTQLLSNGRYQVALRANGAGTSVWGGLGITRTRDDALTDACGHFFYVRWDRQPQAVSITHHPAPDPLAHYSAEFHADRMVLCAAWPALHSRLTVWVSPEDDIEFRQVELHNLSERTVDIELLSAFEPTLVDPRADESHPAFSNLFLGAQWRAQQQALVFERRPRLEGERSLHVAHFIAEGDAQVVALQLQTNRQHWVGRNRTASQPLAQMQMPPASGELALDTGLDPMCAMSLRLRLAPGSKARLVFGTTAVDGPGMLDAIVDRYRQPSHVQRASLMSATMSEVRWRTWKLSPDAWADIQMLTTALVFNLARSQAPPVGEVCDRSLLWRFGLSAERPLLLVSASAPQGLGLIRGLAQALRVWSWGGQTCDLVIVNAEVVTYQSGLQGELQALRDQLARDQVANGADGRVAIFVVRAEDLSADEASTLQHVARLRLEADGRPLNYHLRVWRALHESLNEERLGMSGIALRAVPVGHEPVQPVSGDFKGESGTFWFKVGLRKRPMRPWINVLANPHFGSLISEAGGGFTWAGNSRLNQLTAWSNDPVADPPSEWLLLQDELTRETWSLTPSAWAADHAHYRVGHGQGETTIHHRHGGLEVVASWCVDADAAVRQLRVQLHNHGPTARALRIVSMVEWMMGARRADRATTLTSMHALRVGGAQGVALLCTQRERSGGWGGSTAFVAVTVAEAERARFDIDWTCDRRECVDSRGWPLVPDYFAQRSGLGLDPCAAMSLRLRLPGGETAERVFLLGHGASPQAARDLALRAAAVPPGQRAETVRQRWDSLLGATQVKTPDPLFDVMVNRWLLYQSVSCRLWAKAGFYQAGGATGFRDQLQDTLALAWAAPHMLREQIVLCASRQFEQGDVQHWWHWPTGAGVRTYISDDLLWLPYAVLHYLKASGDTPLLDQPVAFIEGGVIPDGAEDRYDTPCVSQHSASLYEHAARAIDHSLRVGAHGLPLMGGGDWNDGMNRVGCGGSGESVWLGWFACTLVAGFAPLARERGDLERAQRWDEAAAGWQGALLGSAWDGHWYLRAFFDNGQPLGSHANTEARIDLIAQAWAVLSGVAPPQRQREALHAVEVHLADEASGLLRLLDPPLAQALPNAGYIQAYPQGVRENGGQYSHAAIWGLMAQAQMATSSGQGVGAEIDKVYRWFTWLSPAHRSAHPTQGIVYGLEPYVMAGDICSAPPHTGRGGWSWYTGAAAWMHRAAIESVFGLRISAHELYFVPCLPSHWPRCEMTLRRDGQAIHFTLMRLPGTLDFESPPEDGSWLMPGQILLWTELAPNCRFVIPLLH